MQIAVVLNAHNYTNIVLDTIDSIKKNVSDKIFLLVDGHSWNWSNEIECVPKLKGLIHNHYLAPYRNLVLGLKTAIDYFPDTDWICYSEYDVVFCNDKFKEELKLAQDNNVFCIGNNLRKENIFIPYFNFIVKKNIVDYYYLIGCCVFYQTKFLKMLQDDNFYDNFLFYTNHFSKGYFPGFTESRRYDFGEYIFPTLASLYKGNIAGFATWEEKIKTGNTNKFPIRWQPEMNYQEIDYNYSSIIHPVKSIENPIRKYYKIERENANCNIT